MSLQQTNLSLSPDPRWTENRLDAGGFGGFRQRTVQTAAMMRHHFSNRVTDRSGVLVYRRLAPLLPDTTKPTHNVTPERFREQMVGLLQRGRVFWPLEKVLEFEQRQWRVMPWVTLLTFDIGFAGVHAYALPILRELKIPATVFLESDHFSHETTFPADEWARQHHTQSPVEAFRPLTAEECGDLARSGLVTLGCLPAARALSASEASSAETLGPPESQAVGPVDWDERLVPGIDRLGWERIHVASWDSPGTLATRLAAVDRARPTLPTTVRRWFGVQLEGAAAEEVAAAEVAAAQSTAMGVGAGEVGAANVGAANVGAANVGAANVGAGRGGPEQRTTVLPLPSAAFPEPPTISIIVPTYNRAKWIAAALQSLCDQETGGRFSFDIHVVDNASDDGTATEISRVVASSAIPIHYHYEPLAGDAPARNRGLTCSSGDWLAFFDDDQLAEPNWLSELWSANGNGQRPIVGGAVHLHVSDEELAAMDPLCRAALRETRLYTTPRPYRRRDLPGTGNALVARHVFAAVGNFDESMRGGGSDCDFFTRAREAGFPLWYTPAAIIRHRVPAERLTPEFLRWDALSGGAEHADYFDFQRKGLTALLGLCGARLVQAVVWHLPLLLWAQLRGDGHAILGRKTALWRTEGYVRRTLSIIAPAWFAQPQFFESLDLRQGRSICG